MLFWLLRFSPLLFLFNSVVLGVLASGYSWQQNSISSLVHERLGSWQTVNFIACGLLTLGLAFYIKGHSYSHIVNDHLILIGAIVLGLSLVLLGIFPTDMPGQTTLVGQLHGAIFITSVLIQVALQLFLAVSNFPSLMSWYLLVSGVITAIGLPAMALFPDVRGIIQRIFVFAILLWVTSASFWIRK